MSNHVGREQTITVGEKAYRLSRLRRLEWNEFHKWAEKLLPNVLEILAAQIEKYPANLQPLMASQAVELVNEPVERRTNVLIDTPSGWAKLVELLLREHHPDITEDEAWDVATEIKAEMWDIIHRAEGQTEGKAQGKEAGTAPGNESTDSLPKNTTSPQSKSTE